MLKRGTIVDATIITAANINKQARERNKKMSLTRKGNKYYFGMKAHIGVDMNSGLVHHLEVTAAKTNDLEKTEDLCHREEKAIYSLA